MAKISIYVGNLHTYDTAKNAYVVNLGGTDFRIPRGLINSGDVEFVSDEHSQDPKDPKVASLVLQGVLAGPKTTEVVEALTSTYVPAKSDTSDEEDAAVEKLIDEVAEAKTEADEIEEAQQILRKKLDEDAEAKIADLSSELSDILKTRLKEAQEIWDYAENALKHGRRVLLWGPPGTGKSFVGKASRDRSEITSLYLTMDTAGTEVRGCMLPNESGGFSWHDGPLTSAWRKGHLAIVDEIDAASGDTLTELLKYLDDPESAWTTLMNNETIAPHENFQALCTTNQQPSTLPEALVDRFDSIIRIPLPNPKAFDKALWHCDAVREGGLRIIYLRDKPVRTDAGRPVGLRALKSIDRYVAAGLPLQQASETALGRETGEWLVRSLKIGQVSDDLTKVDEPIF